MRKPITPGKSCCWSRRARPPWLIAAAALASLPAALIGVPGAQAQSEPKQTYDLSAAVRQALSSHPSLRSAQAGVDAARAGVRQARAGRLLKVGATGGFMSLDEDPHFRVPSFGTLYFGGRDSTQTAITAQLPLFTGGRLQGMAGQAKAGLTASEGASLRQRQRVAYDATIAYLGARKAQELVKVSQAQLEALQSQRDSIAKMVDRGVSPRLDLLRAETGLASAQEGLTSARNGESVTLAALATAVGLQADPGIVLVADPGPDESFASGDGSLPDDLKAAVEEATRQRPELTQASAGVRAARSGVKVARSAQLPTVGAFAQYDAARYSTMPKTGLWSAGVAVTMNLFDSGATQADVARAKAQVTQAQAAEQELRNGISLEVTQAFLNVGSAKERLTTAQRGAAAAEEGLRLVQAGYQNGVNTITDFLAAQAELTQARTSVAAARYDVSAAEAGLRFALGRGR